MTTQLIMYLRNSINQKCIQVFLRILYLFTILWYKWRGPDPESTAFGALLPDCDTEVADVFGSFHCIVVNLSWE